MESRTGLEDKRGTEAGMQIFSEKMTIIAGSAIVSHFSPGANDAGMTEQVA